MSDSNSITFQDALALLSPQGRSEVVGIVKRACDERGRGWIDSIKEQYPALCWIADLVANHDAAECVTQLENEFGISLALVRGKIFELHRDIRTVIDTPRS